MSRQEYKKNILTLLSLMAAYLDDNKYRHLLGSIDSVQAQLLHTIVGNNGPSSCVMEDLIWVKWCHLW